MVRQEGLEPPTYWFVASYSIQLSYCRASTDSFYILPHRKGKCKHFFAKYKNFFSPSLGSGDPPGGGDALAHGALQQAEKLPLAEQAQAAAASLVAAMASNSVQIVNFTGQNGLSLTDASGNLNIVNNMTIGLMTAAGEAVAQNGSISAAFSLSDILGGGVLNVGETIQALYQRADGTWVAVPVVIIDGTVAIALPAFGGAVNVTFIVAKGTPSTTVPAAAATSPRT